MSIFLSDVSEDRSISDKLNSVIAFFQVGNKSSAELVVVKFTDALNVSKLRCVK